MKSVLLGLIVSISMTAFAQRSPTAPTYSMAGIELGFKSNTASITGATSNKQENGIQLGVSGVFNLADSFGIKSGLFYAERPFAAEIGAATSKGKITYFEVPVLAMMKFEDYAGVYVGPSFAMKLGDEGTPALTSIKGMVMPITLGVQFKFLPNVGVNAFFETVGGELATGVENSRAVGVNLLLTLD